MRSSARKRSSTLVRPTRRVYTCTGMQMLGDQSTTIDHEDAQDLASLFRLLGDPTRVRILHALLRAEELRVSEIAAAVDATETKVSQALRLLRNAGAVRNRRDGRSIFYRLDDDHIRDLLVVSHEHVSHQGS